MKTRNVKGFIISRKNIGEADRLLLIFSREEGKIKAVARGARKLKSKLACQIEPFCVGNFYLVEGKTFNILAGAETKSHCEMISKDLRAYEDLSFISQVIDMLMPESVPTPLFFDKLIDIIQLISDESEEKYSSIIIDYFVYLILYESGYWPEIYKCHSCGKEIKMADKYFFNETGVTCRVCKPDGNLSLNEYKALKLITSKTIYEIISIKDIDKIFINLHPIFYSILEGILPKRIKEVKI